jgi:hypothetical protein
MTQNNSSFLLFHPLFDANLNLDDGLDHRLSVFGARVTFLEGQGLVHLLEKSTEKTKFRKLQTESISGESMSQRRRMTFTILTAVTWTKPIGCVMSMQRIRSKVKTWLHVKWEEKFSSTQSRTSRKIRNSLSGTVGTSHQE